VASSAPRAFRTPAALRAWLEAHHDTAPELFVRCFKVRAAAKGVTYAQMLDEALCFGWIDGVRRGLDDESHCVRLTPRKPRSIWSRVNVAHVKRLIGEGRMTGAGLATYAARTEERTGIYSFERAPLELSPAYERRFRAERAAWAYFQEQAPSYRRLAIFRIMSAKREDTRTRRLDTLIQHSAGRRRIP
jgi:uncharacterized protein YdeI (YjbR/CyaY-like superfamily)